MLGFFSLHEDASSLWDVGVLRSSCAMWQIRLACSRKNVFTSDPHKDLVFSVGLIVIYSIGMLVLIFVAGIWWLHASVMAWFMMCHDVKFVEISRCPASGLRN